MEKNIIISRLEYKVAEIRASKNLHNVIRNLFITELEMMDADSDNLQINKLFHNGDFDPRKKIFKSSMRAVLWQNPQRPGHKQSTNIENKNPLLGIFSNSQARYGKREHNYIRRGNSMQSIEQKLKETSWSSRTATQSTEIGLGQEQQLMKSSLVTIWQKKHSLESHWRTKVIG